VSLTPRVLYLHTYLSVVLLVPTRILAHLARSTRNLSFSAYDISKAAVHQLTKKFAGDFASKHITVNCVAPGFVPSRMSAGLKTWGGSEEELARSIPLQRMGNEDDMFGACQYFSSRAGSWCTGVILNVDGGCVGAQQINLTSAL
jgi:NAD(P)-dependent dehydrogenase (short-subunit alcohol dehydrogenase family)